MVTAKSLTHRPVKENKTKQNCPFWFFLPLIFVENFSDISGHDRFQIIDYCYVNICCFMIIIDIYHQILHFNHLHQKQKFILLNTNKNAYTRVFPILCALKEIELNAFVDPVTGTALRL